MTDTTPNNSPTPRRRGMGSFWKPFLLLLAVGFVGVLSLFPTLGPTAEMVAQRPEVPDVPLFVLKLLFLINPTFLLVVGVAVGTALAPRMGLRSHLAERAGADTAGADRSATGEAEARQPGEAGLAAELPIALGWGVVTAVLILALDALAAPMLGDAAQSLSLLAEGSERSLAMTATGMLYGGITEELIMRWGMVSLLAFVPWRLRQRGHGTPRPWIMWSAILIAAIVFGLAHLPALSTQVALSPAIVVRTVGLNALGGVVFGWLYWRRSLEAAMVAHGTGHVVFHMAAWIAP